MTREEYGAAYEKSYPYTVSLLIARGIRVDVAQETAHAAWAQGWERIGQLRNPARVLLWVNSVALNMFRSGLRKKQYVGEEYLPKLAVTLGPVIRSIDARTILDRCPHNARELLENFYLRGQSVKEISGETNRTETAVRIRLLRARQQAREVAKSNKKKANSLVHH